MPESVDPINVEVKGLLFFSLLFAHNQQSISSKPAANSLELFLFHPSWPNDIGL